MSQIMSRELRHNSAAAASDVAATATRMTRITIHPQARSFQVRFTSPSPPYHHRSHDHRALPDTNVFHPFRIFPWSGAVTVTDVILTFDINQPESLRTLERRWSEFCVFGPLSGEETEECCFVVVGS